METKPSAATPAEKSPGAVAPQPPLPRSIAQLLEWLDPKDYGRVEPVICSMATTKEMVLVSRFLDQVWNQSRNAEFRIGAARITGAEMDVYYDRWKASLDELMKIGIELASRTGLTEILQRHKKVLAHFGYGTSGRSFGGAKTPSPSKVAKPYAPAAVPAAVHAA